ncbi:single-stranded DNA-binding protein [Romboutsia timonensis]|uniref:single-stranded DNA-binding protein n=1 Tax=Romboutsia timonensis TaxID=1776391 RepID=UPI002A8106B8|nr:single-stranded DNA-binding protein [Romboutsia timonensis]MDY3960195.1 single-stranded DNA-binding protein [Romboutsia timonensis]
MNNVVLIGRLTRDPELRYIPTTGTPVANFILAIDREYKNKDGSKEADFIPVQLIGKSAEFCVNYIPKGRLVAIQGSIRVNRYINQNSNENKTYFTIVSRSIKSLESSKSKESNQNQDNSNSFEPKFDPDSFEYIEDDDIPF